MSFCLLRLKETLLGFLALDVGNDTTQCSWMCTLDLSGKNHVLCVEDW